MAAAAMFLRRNPNTKSLLLLRTLSASAAAAVIEPSSSSSNTKKALSRLKSALRSEKNPELIADLFQSSSSQFPKFHSDRSVFALSVGRLSRSRRPDLVEQILESQLSDPNSPKTEGFFVRILTLYSTAGMLDHALRTFDRIPLRTDLSLSALLSAFLTNSQLDRVVDSFHSLPQQLGIASPGIVPHHILLKALCRKGDVSAARNLLDGMPDKGLAPDILSYNTVLSGYLESKDEEGFEEILREMNAKGMEANAATYNARIAAHCRKSEVFKAEELLEVMGSKKIQPNRASFNTVIGGYCRAGDLHSAMRLFKRMRVGKTANVKRDDGSPDSETYNTLLRGLVEKGEFGLALDVCKESLTRKLVPPFEVVKKLVDGLKKNSKAGEVKGITEKMKMALKGDAVKAWEKIEGELLSTTI